MEKSISQDRHPIGTRFYWKFDGIGWGILIFFSGILLYTGRSVYIGIRNANAPNIADISAIIFCLLILMWIILFGSFRPLKILMTTPDRLVIMHGPWRQVMLWRDIARVSEWSVTQDQISYNWIAVWSSDGMRIQIRSDLVQDFVTFRSDVLRRLARAGTLPDAVTDRDETLTVTEDISSRIISQGIAALFLMIAGIFILIATHFDLEGIMTLALGTALFFFLLGGLLFRLHVAISAQGIGFARGPVHTILHWSDIYNLHRLPDTRNGGILSIVGRGFLLVLFRIDRRSGVIFGAARQYSIIELSGSSGVDIRIREKYFIHPEWIRARLRLEIEHLNRHSTDKGKSVEPLPKTGPLAPGTALPPDPIEGDSTVWLRESLGTDPFRIQQ